MTTANNNALLAQSISLLMITIIYTRVSIGGGGGGGGGSAVYRQVHICCCASVLPTPNEGIRLLELRQAYIITVLTS